MLLLCTEVACAQKYESSEHIEKLNLVLKSIRYGGASNLMKALTSFVACFFFTLKMQVHGTAGLFTLNQV